MKKLQTFFVFICACMFLMSCEEEDDRITLTINTSAYDAVKDLKDVNGNNYFAGKLEDGVRIRVNFLVVKQTKTGGDEKVVGQETYYMDDITASTSFTTEELIPGEYRVMVVTDFVKGETAYNLVEADVAYKIYQITCAKYGGVYNAFGTAILKDLSITKKENIVLNTTKRGSLVTMLFKNADKAEGWGYTLDSEKYHFMNEVFTYNSDFGNTHIITASVSSAQHYCGFNKFTIAWYNSRYQVVVTEGKDVIVEMDFNDNLPPR